MLFDVKGMMVLKERYHRFHAAGQRVCLRWGGRRGGGRYKDAELDVSLFVSSLAIANKCGEYGDLCARFGISVKKLAIETDGATLMLHRPNSTRLPVKTACPSDPA